MEHTEMSVNDSEHAAISAERERLRQLGANLSVNDVVETIWCFREIQDPYALWPADGLSTGRVWFACTADGPWIWQGDIGSDKWNQIIARLRPASAA
jgi:hypothetical protein